MTTLKALRESIQVPQEHEITNHIESHGKSFSNPYTLDEPPKKMKSGGHVSVITRVKFKNPPTDKEFGDAEDALKKKFGSDHQLHTMQPIKSTSAWGDFNAGVKNPSVGAKGGHKWTGD